MRRFDTPPSFLIIIIQLFSTFLITVLCLALLGSHACLHNVDYVVAELLTFTHDIHIHRTDGVGVFVVVHVVDVLALELRAVVVS